MACDCHDFVHGGDAPRTPSQPAKHEVADSSLAHGAVFLISRHRRRDCGTVKPMPMLQDLRHAVRLLRREPGYVALAVLAIALGVGATTTLFSVTYGVLMKPLPWRQPDRLVRLEERRGGRSGRIPWTITNGTYLAWRESSTVDAIGGWMSLSSTLSDRGEPERIRLGRLTPTVFSVLDAHALLGRVFEPRDARTRQVDTIILLVRALATPLRRRC